MKTEIISKVKNLENSYNTRVKELNEKLEKLKKDNNYSDSYRTTAINGIKKELADTDAYFNGKLKEIIIETKKSIMHQSASKPADYQMQVANALKFIEIAGEKLTDDQAYGLLKPFQGDFETMKLFKSVVENLNPGDGSSVLEKTFEKTNNFITLVSSLETAENTVDTIFNYDGGLGGALRYNAFMNSISNIEKLGDPIVEDIEARNKAADNNKELN